MEKPEIRSQKPEEVQWPRDWGAEIPARFTGLIFDCDGTIVDTMPVHYVAWCQALQEAGLKMGEERFYSFAGVPTVTIIQTLCREQGKDLDAEALAHRKEELYIARLEGAEPIHSVIEIVKREKGRRKLAVASGGWRRLVKQTLTLVGIEEMFDAIVGADDVVHGKPAPDMFLLAAEKIGVKPSDCLVYEDGEAGMVAARAAGMPVIDVRPWYLPRPAK